MYALQTTWICPDADLVVEISFGDHATKRDATCAAHQPFAVKQDFDQLAIVNKYSAEHIAYASTVVIKRKQARTAQKEFQCDVEVISDGHCFLTINPEKLQCIAIDCVESKRK